MRRSAVIGCSDCRPSSVGREIDRYSPSQYRHVIAARTLGSIEHGRRRCQSRTPLTFRLLSRSNLLSPGECFVHNHLNLNGPLSVGLRLATGSANAIIGPPTEPYESGSFFELRFVHSGYSIYVVAGGARDFAACTLQHYTAA